MSLPPPPPPPAPTPPSPDLPDEEQEQRELDKNAKLERVLITIAVIVGVPIGLAVLGLVALYIACLVT